MTLWLRALDRPRLWPMDPPESRGREIPNPSFATGNLDTEDCGFLALFSDPECPASRELLGSRNLTHALRRR